MLSSAFSDPCWNIRLMGIVLAVLLVVQSVALNIWVKLGRGAQVSSTPTLKRCEPRRFCVLAVECQGADRVPIERAKCCK